MFRAYDIALIPPKEVVEKCYEINEGIASRKNIDFRKHGQLPHITLLMGGVRESDIGSVKEELSAIVASLDPIEITLAGIHEGKFASGIGIAPNEQLNDLYSKIIDQFAGRSKNKVSVADVIGLPNVTD
ncbi:MAG: 2'-5' RNA ligase family protein, partial [Candidatus Dojkabacteria bacterium]